MPVSFSNYPVISPGQEEYVLRQFFNTHREPTLSHPTDREADRRNVRYLKGRIRVLQMLEKNPARDNELALVLKSYELHCWRLFPFYLLPDNILLYVFRLGSFNSPDDWKSPLKPLFYSSVCRRWRHLAMGPKASWLWSSIRFDEVQPFTLTKVYLRLSRDAPLTIELDITDVKFDREFDDYWASASHLVDRLQVLVPHINRWRKLHLRTDNWAPMRGALAFLQSFDAPSLETIVLKQNFENLSLDGPREQLPLFKSIPSLKALTLSSVSIRYDMLASRRHSLRELRLERLLQGGNTLPKIQEFVSILYHSRNLEVLALDSAGPASDNHVVQYMGPAPLPKLKEFVFVGSQLPTLEYFGSVQYFSLVLAMFQPGQRLERLELGICKGYVNRYLIWFREYCRNVKHIIFRQLTPNIPTIAQLLVAFPSVTRITVADRTLQESLFIVLSLPAHKYGVVVFRNILCPSLKLITPCHASPNTRILSERRRLMRHPLKAIVWPTSLKQEALEMMGRYRDMIRFEYEADEDGPTDRWIGPDPSDFIYFLEYISEDDDNDM